MLGSQELRIVKRGETARSKGAPCMDCILSYKIVSCMGNAGHLLCNRYLTRLLCQRSEKGTQGCLVSVGYLSVRDEILRPVAVALAPGAKTKQSKIKGVLREYEILFESLMKQCTQNTVLQV